MKQRTLRDNVLKLLQDAIIDGTLASGAEINQAQVAEVLGISRGPLREALGQLEQQGLVHNVPYRGVYVTPLTERYVEELYSVRSVLETFALEQALAKLQPEDHETLSQIVQGMREAGWANDPERLVALDLAFHRQVIKQADHDLLLRLWDSLEIGMRRCLHARHQIYDNLEEVACSHLELVQAMAEQDLNRSTSWLRAHILGASKQIRKHWAETDPFASGQNNTTVRPEG